jgi:ribosomal protein L11 methyltransferase
LSDRGRDRSIRAFVVTVDHDRVDLASDRLWQLGVRAVEERAPADGGAGTELWTSVGQDDDSIARAAAVLDPEWTWRVVAVPTEFSETWREHVRPIWLADDLVIVPEWIELDTNDDIIRVILEPAGAFGLGDHPTSQLSARALRAELRLLAGRGVTSPSVLDFGSGTGVLSVIAALSGATRVRAIDIAAEAVAATTANAAANGVADVIEVDSAPIDQVDGPYHVVVANILAPVLVGSAAELIRLVGRDGTLIVSGILADAHDHVVRALAPLDTIETTTLDGWAAVVLRQSESDGMRDVPGRLQAP